MEVDCPTKEKLSVDEDENVRILQIGSYLTTIGFNGKRQYWNVRLSRSKSKMVLIADVPNCGSQIRIKVLDIEEVRYGCRTDDLHFARQALNPNDKDAIKKFEDCCFSVHVGKSRESIYSFLAQQSDDAQRWIGVLTQLLSKQSTIHQSVSDPWYWLRRVFREADVNHNGYLTRKELSGLLKSKFNVAMDSKRHQAFNHALGTKVKWHKARKVHEEEFIRFYQLASYRPELDRLFYDLIGNDLIKTLSAEKLLEFLIKEQKVSNLDMDKIRHMITKYDPTFDGIPLAISLNGFRSMIMSEVFDIRKEEHREINQSMDLPMSHYWIKSSNNTYLEKDGFREKSSIEGYCKAFAKNCACVELELWDGPNGEPIIHNGRSPSSKMLARDVLRDGILPFAFRQDDYPIILHIEDHLSDVQRRVFIRDFHDIMGDHVYVVNVKDLISLPSPNQLKGKVIIKASNKKWGKLANICQSVGFPRDALKKEGNKAPVTHVPSLSNKKINRLFNPTFIEWMLCDDESAKIRRKRMRHLTARQLIRFYHESYDYNPIDAMNAGCQMVAMNVQTNASNLAIYEGRFRANGDCGFALKPDFLIDPSAPRVGPKRVQIKIISGQNIPSKSPNSESISSPSVSVRVEGEECDKVTKTTEIVRDNGLNPVWNTEMVFDVQVPELAVILFQAQDNDGRDSTNVGTFALPILSLATGYRHISLKKRLFNGYSDYSNSLSSNPIDKVDHLPPASLFVKVNVGDI